METFAVNLFRYVNSPSLFRSSIRAWIKGDYEGAMRGFPDHVKAELIGKGGAS